LIRAGQAKLDHAVRLDPGDYAVRLYLGTVLLQLDDDAGGAVGEYRQFLADGLRRHWSSSRPGAPSGLPAGRSGGAGPGARRLMGDCLRCS